MHITLIVKHFLSPKYRYFCIAISLHEAIMQAIPGILMMADLTIEQMAHHYELKKYIWLTAYTY